MLVGCQPILLVAGQERAHAAGFLAHPLEFGRELLIGLHVPLRLVAGDRKFLEGARQQLPDPGPVGPALIQKRRELLPRFLGRVVRASRQGAHDLVVLAEIPLGRVLLFVEVAHRGLTLLAQGLQTGEEIADAAHELEDGLLLLAHLAQKPRSQEVFLARGGCRRGNLVGLAVERFQERPGLGEVARNGLPRLRGEVALQLGLEGLVLSQCLAEPPGLVNPLGLVVFAKLPGLEHSVQRLLGLLEQRLRRLHFRKSGLGSPS